AWGWFTLAPLSSRRCTAAVSPRIAASATSDAFTQVVVASRSAATTPPAREIRRLPARLRRFIPLLPQPTRHARRQLDVLQPAGAVAEALSMDIELVEEAQQQVARPHRLGRIRQVAITRHPAVVPAEDHVRNVVMQVLIRVAHVAAVQDQRMIEQRAVALLRARELVRKVREHL